MKHNQIIANQHFHKNWDRYVRTWFNQPARKVRRRNNRSEKAKLVLPRPLHKLRPVVQCATVKYNMMARAGKGFTLDELKAAKVRVKEAKGLGISVDHRRRNKSEEGFTRNVERLRAYKKKLVVFPRNPSSKKKGVARDDDKPMKRGCCSRTAMKAAFTQNLNKTVLDIDCVLPRLKPTAITAAMTSTESYTAIRAARHSKKFAGQWEKKRKDKAALKLSKKN